MNTISKEITTWDKDVNRAWLCVNIKRAAKITGVSPVDLEQSVEWYGTVEVDGRFLVSHNEHYGNYFTVTRHAI